MNEKELQLMLEILKSHGRLDGVQDEAAESWLTRWIEDFDAKVIANDPEIRKLRQDTSTAIFPQQLEHMLAKMYDKRYPGHQTREMVPFAQGIPSGAETVATVGHDIKGEATLLHTYGEDIRNIGLDGNKSITPIVGVAAAWLISIQQIRAASMAGMPLNEKGIMAAKRMISQKFDDLLADGEAAAGVTGLLTQTDVTILNQSTTPALNGDWEAIATTADDILEDVATGCQQIENTKVWAPTDLLVDYDSYVRMRKLRIGPDTSTTVLDFIEDKYDLTVHKYNRNDEADAAGTGPRCVMYQRDNEVLEGVISQDIEQLPSVWDGLNWRTIMHGRCGGVKSENPAGMIYLDHQDS